MATIPHPRRAIAFVQHPSERNRTPAILWLGVLLLGLWVLRNGGLPNARQAVTGGAAIAGLVIVGTFIPRILFYVLVALVAAAVLGLSPQVTALLAQLQSQGISVALRPGAPASAPK